MVIGILVAVIVNRWRKGGKGVMEGGGRGERWRWKERGSKEGVEKEGLSMEECREDSIDGRRRKRSRKEVKEGGGRKRDVKNGTFLV